MDTSRAGGVGTHSDCVVGFYYYTISTFNKIIKLELKCHLLSYIGLCPLLVFHSQNVLL